MKLAIVEDSELVRDQLVRSFSLNQAISIVGWAVAEDQAVTLILRTEPDIVLLDLTLLEGNGIRVLERIRAAGSKVKVMVLSNNTNAAIVSACQAHGISGYFDKSRDFQNCLDLVGQWAGNSHLLEPDQVPAPTRVSANEALFQPARAMEFARAGHLVSTARMREGAAFEVWRHRSAHARGALELLNLIRSGVGLKHRLYRLGRTLIAARKLAAMCAWLSGDGIASLSREIGRHNRLGEILFRPYLNRHWRMDDRMRAISGHYRRLTGSASVLDIGDNQCRELAALNLEEQTLRVALFRPHWMPMEGEMGLNVYVGDERIYTVMFLIGDDPSCGIAMYVGCLVGWRNESAKEDFKALTKELYGVRPRDFVLHMAKLVAAELGCGRLLCVSDDAHRGSHWLSEATKQVSFDAIWNDHGGELQEDGFFAIPARIAVKEYEDIPAKKRAQYKRRYAMFDGIRDQIHSTIADFKSGEQDQARSGFGWIGSPQAG